MLGTKLATEFREVLSDCLHRISKIIVSSIHSGTFSSTVKDCSELDDIIYNDELLQEAKGSFEVRVKVVFEEVRFLCQAIRVCT